MEEEIYYGSLEGVKGLSSDTFLIKKKFNDIPLLINFSPL